MKWATVSLIVSALLIGIPVPGGAQEPTRPATTTFWGDTGLWFVPTGEVLPGGDFSFSAHRSERDFQQGNTNVSFWPVTGALGVGRVELFGAMRVITRIDRDTSPLLFQATEDKNGGLVNEYPTVHESWSGNRLGDLFLGGKVNFASPAHQHALALAARGTLKFPTADSDDGAGTGEYDGFLDLIASREFAGLELAGFGGVAVRGDPADLNVSDGFRWGAGAEFPPRRSLRATAEVYGEWLFDKAVTAPEGLVIGTDGSLSPASSRLNSDVNTAFGVTWQHSSGLLLGAVANYRFGVGTNATSPQGISTSGDGFAMEFRIGFHPGVGVYVRPPSAIAAAPSTPVPPAPPAAAAPAPPPAAPAPAANRQPAVRAVCQPCTVRPGEIVTLRAEASDPDGDPLTFVWSATGGALADTRTSATTWRAETAPGLITLAVTARDGRGAEASDVVTVEVATGIEFEDVHFDFDSFRLRREALPLLEPAVAALRQNPQMRLVIEGHTCSIGSAEYNVALGERRANAVRDYLIGQGVEAARLSTVSYGEDHPAHDNAQESTRKLNRRAVLVIRSDSE